MLSEQILFKGNNWMKTLAIVLLIVAVVFIVAGIIFVI
jgi:hypothetical protein